MIKKVILIIIFSPLIMVAWLCGLIAMGALWVLCKVGVIE